MKRTSKKLLSWVLTLAMVLSMVPAMTLTAAAAEVSYIDAAGTAQTVTDPTTVTESMNGQTLTGWYVVNSNVSVNYFYLSNDVHLILAKDCTLSANQILGFTNGNLTIYGQSDGAGTLTVNPTSSNNHGITIYNMTVNGGTVTAAGNGAGYYGINANTDVTINGGTVTANGGNAADALGSAGFGIFAQGKVTINGGTVTANGGTAGTSGHGILAGTGVEINGGTVTATGSGDDSHGISTNGGLTIDPKAEVLAGDSSSSNSEIEYDAYNGEKYVHITFPHKHTLCGEEGCTDHSEITFTAWESDSSLPTTAGNYYLTTDVTLSAVWKPGDGINLCLNGHVLEGSGSANVIWVNKGVTFNLCDCGTTEHKFVVSSVEGEEGLWKYQGAWNSGSDTETDTIKKVTGGIITGGVSGYGGAIRNQGTLNIFGGNLVGNTAPNDGGAVRNDGTFNMSGGAILGCVATNGGAVFNASAATSFTLSGTAMIGYCHASSENNGGGVYNLSQFTMGDDAVITECTAENGSGGGVFTSKGTFEMTGGEITYNTAKYGGGIELQGINDNIEVEVQGKVSNNTAVERGGGIEVNGGTLVVGEYAEVSSNTAKFGGGIMLQRNAVNSTAEVSGEVSENKSTIHGGGIKVDGGTLVVKAGAEIADNESANGGGIFVAGNSKSIGGVTVEKDAVISENVATNNGGGIALQSNYDDTKVEVQGEVSGNTSGAHGAGIQVNGGTLDVKEDAEITKNHATKNGGGIYSTTDLKTSTSDLKKSTITLNGKVSENKAEGGEGGGLMIYKAGSSLTVGDNAEISKNEAATNGGGICVNQGNVAIINGTICENIAQSGGGVFVYSENVTVGGSAVISGNKKGTAANNVYLPEGMTLTIGSPAPNGMDIHVSTANNSVGDVIVKNEDGAAAQYATNFKSDNGTKTVKFEGGALVLASKYSGGSGSSAEVYYSVSAPSSVPHGKVAVSPTSATAGKTVTITVTPDKGYTLETLTVKTANGKEVELTKVNDTTYTFKMPGSKVTVEATFMEDNSMLNFFVDVHANDYYYDAVLWAAENGITSGTDAVHFTPNGVTTRAQVVTFLWRAAGCPEPKAMSSFSDVAAGSYYEKAVAWAVENGITSGVGGKRFAPDADCTRSQIVTFLYRFNGMDTMNIKDNPFGDVAEGEFYYDAVLWAAENGVTSGTSATTFSPASNCLRGQVVTFLYRLMAE